MGWVLKKPVAEQMDAIEDSITRSLPAVPLLLAGDVPRATMLLHTRAPAPGKGG